MTCRLPVLLFVCVSLVGPFPFLVEADDRRVGAKRAIDTFVAQARRSASKGGQPLRLVFFGPGSEFRGVSRARRLALIAVPAKGAAAVLRECPLALPLHPDHVQPVTFAVAPDGTLRGAESVTLLGSGEHADRTRDALRLRAADGALVFEDLRVDPLARSAEALIRGQLSTAARVPLFEVRRVVKSDGPLKWASAGRSRSLTLLLAVRSHSKSIRDRLCLDWSLSVPPDRISPVVFQEELEREIGKFTVLQLADIRDYRCRVGKSTVGTYAQGSVRVEHRGSFGWKLVVKWRARLEGARWRIHEFVLPKGQLALRQEKAGSPWSLIDLRENTSDREAQEGR